MGGPTATNTPLGAPSPTPSPTCYAPPTATATATATATPTRKPEKDKTPVPAPPPPAPLPFPTPNANGSICLANLLVTVFHDANGNGRWDEGEAALPGWTVDVNGPNGARLVTGPQGTAWVGNLANGYAYTVELTVPSEGGWYSTTPNPLTWMGDCTEVQFGVNFLLLPNTGVRAFDALSSVARLAAGRAALAQARPPAAVSGRAALAGPTVAGWLQTAETLLGLSEADPGATPPIVNTVAVSRSPLGGLRLWKAHALFARSPVEGATLVVAYDGEMAAYRVEQVAVVPAGRETALLDNALPDSLVVVTPIGPGGANRLLVRATRR